MPFQKGVFPAAVPGDKRPVGPCGPVAPVAPVSPVGPCAPVAPVAPVALQQGRLIAKNIINEINGKPRKQFHYINKGQLSAIGRNKAILEIGIVKLYGFPAWIIWLFVHIYYLIGFRNKFLVFAQWAFSYLTYQKGARLVVNKTWRFYSDKKEL